MTFNFLGKNLYNNAATFNRRDFEIVCLCLFIVKRTIDDASSEQEKKKPRLEVCLGTFMSFRIHKIGHR